MITETLMKRFYITSKYFERHHQAKLCSKIMSSKEFLEFLSDFEATTDIRSTMTMQYLRDVPLMSTIVSTVREGHFDRHPEAERQFLKLVFAFDHVDHARYNAYQHVFLTNLKKYESPSMYCTDLN